MLLSVSPTLLGKSAPLRALSAAAFISAAECRAGESAARPPSRAGNDAEVGLADAGACLARLSSLGVQFRTEAASSIDEACAIAIPIRLQRLTVHQGAGSSIDFPARPLIDCRLAEPLARWVSGVVAPVLAESFSSVLKAVKTGPGFECRNRNREAAGKLSAHAIGFALDISGFELASGRVLSFGLDRNQVALSTVRTAACGWFTTVLGPGSDAAHDDHLHVDIQMHGAEGRNRICE